MIFLWHSLQAISLACLLVTAKAQQAEILGQVFDGSPPPERQETVSEGLDALHQIYANREAELQNAYGGRQARNEQLRAERKALAANPPPLEDVVIQFWPGEGSRYHRENTEQTEPATQAQTQFEEAGR